LRFGADCWITKVERYLLFDLLESQDVLFTHETLKLTRLLGKCAVRILAYKTFFFEALLRDYFADGPSCTDLSKTKLLCALLCKDLLKKTSIPDKGSLFRCFDIKLYLLLSL